MLAPIPRGGATGDTRQVIVPAIRVLLVDDSPTFLQAARAFLVSRGLRVVGSVESGGESLAAVDSLNPDLVLMDLNMPGMTGLEATRMIKKSRPGIRVIIMSLEGDWWDCQDTDDPLLGADGFISKSRFTEASPAVIGALFGNLQSQPASGNS